MAVVKSSAPERHVLLSLIVDQLVDAIITITPDQRIVVANDATSKIFGYELDELLTMKLTELIPVRFRDAHERGVIHYLRSGGSTRRREGYIDVMGLTRSGVEVPMSLSMTCMFHDGVPYVTGVLRDMSALSHANEIIHRQVDELQAANARLQALADQDPLTGVLNRRALQRLLPEFWTRSTPQVPSMGILLCDIDHFKQFNDNYGHLEGDRCLIAVAKAIQLALQRDGAVARFGGEEFIAVLDTDSSTNLEQAAERMKDAVSVLEIPHEHSSAGRFVSVSIGAALHHPTHPNAEAVLRSADDALYIAKRVRNRIVLWDPKLLGASQ